MEFCVKSSNRFNVEVYVWKDGENIKSTINKSNVPQDVESKTVTFTFRRPSYGDSQAIIKSSLDSTGTVNNILLTEQVLYTLLVDWSLTDEDDKPLRVTNANISSLVPSIATAAAAGGLSKMSFV